MIVTNSLILAMQSSFKSRSQCAQHVKNTCYKRAIGTCQTRSKMVKVVMTQTRLFFTCLTRPKITYFTPIGSKSTPRYVFFTSFGRVFHLFWTFKKDLEVT